MSVIECRQRVEEIERSMEMVHDKSKTAVIIGNIFNKGVKGNV